MYWMKNDVEKKAVCTLKTLIHTYVYAYIYMESHSQWTENQSKVEKDFRIYEYFILLIDLFLEHDESKQTMAI